MNPRVSFVVPSYNYAHFLPDAVDSLLSQSFESLEVIVVDDASTDDTRTVVQRYADEPRVRVIRHETNKGNIATYNDGIAAARGEFVGLLSADDYCIRRDAVERQVAMFDAHPTVGFVHAAYEVVDAGGGTRQSFRAWPSDSVRPGLEEFERLCFSCYVSASGTLVRTRSHAELGVYDPQLPVSADWDLWLRLCTRYDVGFISEPLFAYRTHAANMHHSGVSPKQATRNHVATIERAFAALPATAPPHLRDLRAAAIRNAWLVYSTDARRGGRSRQSWSGLVDAARRSPGLLATAAWWAAAAKTAAQGALGPARYARVSERRGRRHSSSGARHASPPPAAA
jgi:glycosyltransferase involved in cell wall biosynthesis